MNTLRCDRQSLLLLTSMSVFGLSNLVYLAAIMRVTGIQPLLLIVMSVMVFYVFHSLRGTLEALSVYHFDERGIERRHPLKRTRMGWDEVRDLRIRRSTGDASIYLKDAAGHELRADFQLLGDAGASLLRLLMRKLQPLIATKLAEIERAPRLFPRRHLGFIPISGSVTAGGGVIRRGAVTLDLDGIRQISVKEVKKLVATQEYVVQGDASRLCFISFIDDSPLLLKYLRARVPEERWTLARSSGVTMAKLSALLLVPVMAWAALTMGGLVAGRIAVERALAVRSERADAVVLGTAPIDQGRFQLAYNFPLANGKEGFGEVVASGTPPAPGQHLFIRYDPQRPHYNQPEEGQGVEVPKAWSVLGPTLAMLFLSLPYAAVILAFKVREDPFAEWISAEVAEVQPA